MKILQFGFGTDSQNDNLPHHLTRDTVIYTGTHDNDTTVGLFSQAPEQEREFARRYAGSNGIDVAWDLIRLAFSSVAELAVVPLQDVLRLGTAARMNLPGRAAGNWAWRFESGDVDGEHTLNLRSLAETYGRATPDSLPPA